MRRRLLSLGQPAEQLVHRLTRLGRERAHVRPSRGFDCVEGAIVGGAGEVMGGAALEEVVDKGEERVALDAVLVELLGLTVRSRHHHQAVREEIAEEAAHDEGVGHVCHLEFVKAEQRGGAGDVVCDVRHRVTHVGVRLPQLVHPPVHLQHELVEMYPPLAPFLERDAVIERVHQQ